MNHALAVLFHERGPKFQLYETDESDVKHAHDFVVPLPRIDSKGVRIIMVWWLDVQGYLSMINQYAVAKK